MDKLTLPSIVDRVSVPLELESTVGKKIGNKKERERERLLEISTLRKVELSGCFG